MAQPVHLSDVTKRPMQYWNCDGLEELMFGLGSIVLGATQLIVHTLPRGSSISSLFAVVGLALVIFVPFVVSRVVKKLKERITFPRGGYVALSRPAGRNRFFQFIVLSAWGFGFSWMLEWRGAVAPRVALAFSVVSLLTGLYYKMPHMLGHDAFMLLLGAWMYHVGAGTGAEGLWWVIIWSGCAMVFSGALRFRTFLKTVPLPELTEE